MTDQALHFLRALQHGDSFFPSGATSMSNGLEALQEDGVLNSGESLMAFINGQIIHRWNCFERPFLRASMTHFRELDELIDIDLRFHAQSLCEEARAGSMRTGRALLGVHRAMNTEGADEFHTIIQGKRAHGHNVVIQGLVWGEMGISPEHGELTSAYAFCTGFLGAAIRLGMIGHAESQRILLALSSEIVRLIEVEPRSLELASSFCPEQEVAMMRHETQSSRLFLN